MFGEIREGGKERWSEERSWCDDTEHIIVRDGELQECGRKKELIAFP